MARRIRNGHSAPNQRQDAQAEHQDTQRQVDRRDVRDAQHDLEEIERSRDNFDGELGQSFGWDHAAEFRACE